MDLPWYEKLEELTTVLVPLLGTKRLSIIGSSPSAGTACGRTPQIFPSDGPYRMENRGQCGFNGSSHSKV